MSKAATDTLQKVSSEFEAEVLAVLQQGVEGASTRVEAARKGTAVEVAKILETGEKQAEAVKRQIVGSAELEARNTQLRALERAVNEVFDRAVKDVSGSTDEKALQRLLAEGVEVIGPKARVWCSSKDKRSVTSALKKLNKGSVRLTLEDKPIETIGGVVLSSADGSVKFDNTFEARLERMRPTLRKDVAGVLTGGS